MSAVRDVYSYPYISCVEVFKDLAEERARGFRDEGLLVSVVPRTVKAKRARITVYCIVLTGRKKS